MSAEWKYSTFSCFSDCRLCIMSFFCPCVQLGRNAEYFGESCCLVGALTCLCAFPYGPIIRHRLRTQRDIKGSMTMDIVCYLCAPCCSIEQEAREIQEMQKGHGTIVTHTTRTVHVYNESSSATQPLAMARQ